MKRLGAVAALAALLLYGCAKNANTIGAAYISPILYENLSCQQITEEAIRVSARAAELTGTQNKQASKDAVAMGVGLIVFWPALFFIGGNDQQTAELARMKGEMQALEQASIKKNCGIQFRAAPKS